MKQLVSLLGAACVLAACTSFGPPAIHLARSDIAQRAFVDREQTDLRKVFGQFQGLAVTGPDVGIQTQAERVQLEWTFRLKESPVGLPLSVYVAISGKPELNEGRTGIDLADARIEQIRLPSIPFFNIGPGTLSAGEALGRLPLLAFRPDELNRDGVIYQATNLAVGTFGVRVDLSPK
ncbi:MAG: hypothetical protein ACXW2G_10995 [Burkholderiaceae bacterium]